eukprot:6213891-Pleurochrysis_carterae.AAC.2
MFADGIFGESLIAIDPELHADAHGSLYISQMPTSEDDAGWSRFTADWPSFDTAHVNIHLPDAWKLPVRATNARRTRGPAHLALEALDSPQRTRLLAAVMPARTHHSILLSPCPLRAFVGSTLACKAIGPISHWRPCPHLHSAPLLFP